ncbi:diguanylate cyclase CdgB [Streptomyces kronopolitis]|uniref:diguanylate cyclase CdgB n=1 Tax=Streptomyces TaxID=1883 RepID=UPI00201BF695|nr:MULTISPECIES: diguanylate cyclase CdgB [Streptomyces]MCL6302218.1 diguanylate cyclase CdgB [Streptomyces kronopolitis]GLW16598.1 diguanylate cyclase [Streptomyces sp. NBRC 13847]
METESEPYVRLATLRQLHQVVAELNTARSLADTLQTVADGAITGLGFELAAVNLVRPDGDLVVAAVAGSAGAEALMAGRVGSRAAWDRRLSMGERWGDLIFIPHTEGWVLDDDDVPQWHTAGPAPRFPDEWHSMDRLFAPMYTAANGGGELLGVVSVDRPRNGRRPGPWGQEALQMYAFQSAIAISNARLRANMQRALVRLEREQQALRASEESFRQAFEYAPSGMAVAEMGGDQHGRLLRTNDALCRLLGRPASGMRRYSFSDLVHPEDIGTLLRTSAEGGRAELRLARRDGTYVWVSLRNSVVADTADGPRFLLTHVEDIEERKRHELQLAHRASHDSLTGLPNSAELRSRLGARLCSLPPASMADAYASSGGLGIDPHGFRADGKEPFEGIDGFEGNAPAPFDHHVHLVAPADGPADDGSKGLAVLFCDLDGFKSINDRFGHNTGDAVLIEVARRLTSGVRDGDTVARLGGDEFVVLADGLGTADAQDLAVRLRNAIIPPIRVEGRAVRVGASFGIGWASCGMTAEEVLESADQRMYVEKRSRSKANRRAAG